MCGACVCVWTTSRCLFTLRRSALVVASRSGAAAFAESRYSLSEEGTGHTTHRRVGRNSCGRTPDLFRPPTTTLSRPIPSTEKPAQATMATELTVQSERAFQKQPHININSKAQGKRVGKGGRRWHKDVGLGFRTPKTAIEGSYIGTWDLPLETARGRFLDERAGIAARLPAWE